MTFGDNGDSADLTDKNAWKTMSVIVSARGQGTNNLNFTITGSGNKVTFLVRNLKLTPNDFATTYSNYGVFPVYEN